MFSAPQAPGLTSLSRLKTSRYAWILAFLVLGMLVLVALGLVGIPWYQSVSGMGRVIVYNPMDRAQEVDALIPGRIVNWYVREGQTVKKGDRLALLQDIDSKFLDPQQLLRTDQMLLAYRQKRELVSARLQALEAQRDAIMQARSAALPAAQQRVEQSRQRFEQNRQSLLLSEQNLHTDQLQLKRMRLMENQGLRSRRDLELTEQSLVRSQTDLERSRQSLVVAQRDIEISRLERERLSFSLDNDLAKVAESSIKARENLAEVEAEILKLEIDRSSLSQRRQQQLVVAPRSGRVVRLLKLGEGKSVKAGDPLCSLMPVQSDPAVELMISDFDAPLVRPGQKVRLMFDGFPAIPFTAFPWSAVGTYGGVVSVVDAHDDGSGRYRVFIQPDRSPGSLPWPKPQENEARYPLRPGTQVQGWVMMDRPVPLYWEVWRRLNAFPPVPFDSKSDSGKSDSGKAEKSHTPKPVLKR
ncbi:HlyD family efflux transporter periplasmic adaptor subunit [bacterium]|nr:HlyD family efflux transporter periplasmic adaptor subunit [bacterium]